MDQKDGAVFLPQEGVPPDGQVSSFDICSGLERGTTAIGNLGFDAALDPLRDLLFVTQPGSYGHGKEPAVLLTLDTHSGAIVHRSAIPPVTDHFYLPANLAVDSVRGVVYMLSYCETRVIQTPCPPALFRFDERTRQLRHLYTVNTPNADDALPQALAVDERAGRICILTLNSLIILDANGGAPVRTYKWLLAISLAVDSTSGHLYVDGTNRPDVPPFLQHFTVLDTKTGSVIGSIPGSRAIVIDPILGRISVVCGETAFGTLCQYDSHTNRQVLRVKLPDGLNAAAVDLPHHHLLAFSTFTGKVAVLDERTGHVLAEVQVSTTRLQRAQVLYALSGLVVDAAADRAFILDLPVSNGAEFGPHNAPVTLSLGV